MSDKLCRFEKGEAGTVGEDAGMGFLTHAGIVFNKESRACSIAGCSTQRIAGGKCSTSVAVQKLCIDTAGLNHTLKVFAGSGPAEENHAGSTARGPDFLNTGHLNGKIQNMHAVFLQRSA